MTHSGRVGLSGSQIRQAIEKFTKESHPPIPPQPDTQAQAVTLPGAFFWRRVFARSIDLLFTIPLGILLYIIVSIPIEVVRALTTIPYILNFAVDLVFREGTEGANQYGPDPLAQKQRGD